MIICVVLTSSSSALFRSVSSRVYFIYSFIYCQNNVGRLLQPGSIFTFFCMKHVMKRLLAAMFAWLLYRQRRMAYMFVFDPTCLRRSHDLWGHVTCEASETVRLDLSRDRCGRRTATDRRRRRDREACVPAATRLFRLLPRGCLKRRASLVLCTCVLKTKRMVCVCVAVFVYPFNTTSVIIP